MRKRAAWFVWYISSLYWQASTSSGRARRCSPINGLAAHITVVFLHREIKNSILNRQPWDVMHNTCSKSIETLHCLLNCCFQHEPRLSSSIYFCFRRELQEISGRRIPFLSLKHVKIKKITWSADPNQWPDFFFHPLPKLLMEVALCLDIFGQLLCSTSPTKTLRLKTDLLCLSLDVLIILCVSSVWQIKLNWQLISF